MKLPLTENGIYITLIAMAMFGAGLIAEMWAVRLAEEPVKVHLGNRPESGTVRSVRPGTTSSETEELQLVRSEDHRRAMTNPVFRSTPRALLDHLAQLREREGSSPALLNDMGVTALRADRRIKPSNI